MESWKRSLTKALSYRLGGAVVTGMIVWVLSGEFIFGVKVGLLDTLLKFIFYFIHERIWNRISFGRGKPPEYEI